MNAKEKAIELVAQFTSKWFGNSVESNIYVIKNIPIYGSFDQFHTAKECALVAVDEMIEQIAALRDSIWYDQQIDYLTDVKIEIENL